MAGKIMEKFFDPRKPKRGRSQNGLYLPVIIDEYEYRPQILRGIISNGVNRNENITFKKLEACLGRIS